MDDLRIGVDLGGTKIEAVALRIERDRAPDVLARLRVPTERDRGYDHVLATTARVIADVARDAGFSRPAPIGVGMPGNVTLRAQDGSRSDVELVKNSNTTCLNGRPFRRDLTERVGAPIAFANDANCFALAEATFGAARGARVAFGVILGSGVGGGVVFREGDRVRAWDGAQGIAGEWGHVSLDPAGGEPCYCGRRGCIETMISGPAIERAYAARAGVSRSLAEIAASSEPAAIETIDSLVETFGRALAIVVNVLDPDVIVLGGGVSNVEALYDAGARALERWVFNDELRTRLARNALGDSAGVYGASLLTIDKSSVH